MRHNGPHVEDGTELGVFDAFWEDRAVCVNPLSDDVRGFGCVGVVTGVEEGQVTVENLRSEVVKEGEFAEDLGFLCEGLL